MSKLTDAMFDELTEIITDKIEKNQKINKYEILREARANIGEFVRYRDVRDDLDEVIRDVANYRNVVLESYYTKTADGKVYKEYIVRDNDCDEDDDDSDIANSDIVNNDGCDEADDNHDNDENSNISDDVFYFIVDSRGRIYIPTNILAKLDIYKIVGIERDRDNNTIILNGAFAEDYVDFGYYHQITVGKTLDVDEGDTVQMYKHDDMIYIQKNN